MKRICSWCQTVIDQGYGRHASLVTYGICSTCKATIDGEIAAAEQLQLTETGSFPCPNCPGEGSPYKVRDDGARRIFHIRCRACRLTWIAETNQHQ